MTREDLRTLRLLEAVEASEAPTQRELARDLHMSLGLVNNSVKRLAREGYLEISTTSRNRVKYLLNSRGMQEKSRLTCEYLDYSIGFYRRIKDLLQALFSRLEKEGVQRLALYGRGELAEVACLVLADSAIGLVGIFDENAEGATLCGHPVNHWKTLAATTFDCVLISSTDEIEEHRQRLLRAGVAAERILHLGGHLLRRVSLPGRHGLTP